MKKAAEMTNEELARYIDYAVLKPELSEGELIRAAEKAAQLKVRSLCINPCYIRLLEPYVRNSETKISPVADFPFGTSSTASRLAQLDDVLKYDCVEEIDIVMNYGMLKSGKYEEVTEDLKACADRCHAYGKILKVILETDALSEEEIRKGCDCVVESGADFVKSSTGFLTGHELRGAATDVMALIKEQVNGACRIKGSGCIRTRERMNELIDMGIDRLGVNYTSVIRIMEG